MIENNNRCCAAIWVPFRSTWMLFNTMKYVQAVAIAKKCADFVSSFHEWHPCRKRIQFNIPPRLHKSSSRRLAHFFSIMHITCLALFHTRRRRNTYSCWIRHHQRTNRLQNVSGISKKQSSNRDLIPWFVPSPDQTNPRHTILLFFQPGSINWIPNN